MGDTFSWKEILLGVMALLSSFIVWATKKQIARIDALEKCKAGKRELEQQKADFEQHERDDRENFRDLFRGQETTRQMIADGFADMSKTLNGIHTSVLHELAKKADRE